MQSQKILSIGEVVWDIFPDREVLGGAPLNVAYQLHTMAPDVECICRVGDDQLGRRTLEKIGGMGLSTRGVQVDGDLDTGRVVVTIGEEHEPSFDIVAPAAWDAIALEPALALTGQQPFLMVFGTLAQRSPVSRETIRTLWQRAAVRCYDVNLRPPYTDSALVQDSLAVADLVKMNEEELKTVAGWFGISAPASLELGMGLKKKFDLETMVITRGAAGAWVLSPDGYFNSPGFPVEVKDTVGSGDAFFAEIIGGRLAGRPWPEILDRANRRGAYVASRAGATPSMADLAVD